jgi:hypothetical protein
LNGTTKEQGTRIATSNELEAREDAIEIENEGRKKEGRSYFSVAANGTGYAIHKTKKPPSNMTIEIFCCTICSDFLASLFRRFPRCYVSFFRELWSQKMNKGNRMRKRPSVDGYSFTKTAFGLGTCFIAGRSSFFGLIKSKLDQTKSSLKQTSNNTNTKDEIPTLHSSPSRFRQPGLCATSSHPHGMFTNETVIFCLRRN